MCKASSKFWCRLSVRLTVVRMTNRLMMNERNFKVLRPRRKSLARCERPPLLLSSPSRNRFPNRLGNGVPKLPGSSRCDSRLGRLRTRRVKLTLISNMLGVTLGRVRSGGKSRLSLVIGWLFLCNFSVRNARGVT